MTWGLRRHNKAICDIDPTLLGIDGTKESLEDYDVMSETESDQTERDKEGRKDTARRTTGEVVQEVGCLLCLVMVMTCMDESNTFSKEGCHRFSLLCLAVFTPTSNSWIERVREPMRSEKRPRESECKLDSRDTSELIWQCDICRCGEKLLVRLIKAPSDRQVDIKDIQQHSPTDHMTLILKWLRY